MNAPRWATFVASALLAVTLAGCVSTEQPPTTSGPTAEPSALSAATPTATPRVASTTESRPPPTPPADCPVTIGVEGPEEVRQGLFGWSSSYGNPALWVGGLWPGGVIVPDPRWVNASGATGIKFGWWRFAEGKLTITGRRLDADAPPAIASVPDGYGNLGFQATGVTFPTLGCWEVIGTVDGADLTFVTFLVEPPG